MEKSNLERPIESIFSTSCKKIIKYILLM